MNAIDKRPKEILLGDLLPYIAYENERGLLWLKDGSATKTFAITPKSCLSSTDEELENLRAQISSVLSQVPEGTFLQFYLMRDVTDAETDLVHKNWVKSHLDESFPATEASEKLFESKKEVLQNFWNAALLYQTKIYITVRISSLEKMRAGAHTGVFSHLAYLRRRKSKTKSADQILSEIQQAYDTLRNGFSGIGFEAFDVPEKELLRVIFQFINPDRRSDMGFEQDKHTPLSETLALSELIESKCGLNLGRTKIRIGTLKALPESAAPCLMSSLATLAHSFALVLTVLILPQTEEKERLSRKQRLTQGMASGNTVRNLYAETQLQDIEETMSAMISSGDKLLASSFHIAVFNKEA